MNGVSQYLNLGVVLAFVLCTLSPATANEVWFNEFWAAAGQGPQPGQDDQDNRLFGLDWFPWHYQKSNKQTWSVGLSYAHLHSRDTNDIRGDNSVNIVSLVPQLTLTLDPWYHIEPVFQIRALGPSYQSRRRLGGQEQGTRFTFQNQISIGARFGTGFRHQMSLSYRHYSNASLEKPNDGFDVPLIFSYLFRFH